MKVTSEEPKNRQGAMYHIGLTKDQIGEIAFLPGDPDRVPNIAAHFKDAEELSSHREYKTWGGYIGKRYVTVTSTGIGGPAAAIAIEELARLGVKTMIRIGTCGAIRKDVGVGSVIIAEAAVRMDGTSRQYVTEGYPAAADAGVTVALKESAIRLKKKYVLGITASTDSFYVGQGREGFEGYLPSHAKSLISDLQAARVACFEMESSTLFTIGRLYGIRTGALFGAIANRETRDFRINAGVEDAIEIAVDAAARL